MLPFVTFLVQANLGNCGNEELIKFVMVSCSALQGISLVLVFFLHPKVRKMLKSFNKKVSTNASDASLAPSAISTKSSTRRNESIEPFNNWNDFVTQARNSICEGNLYTTEPQLIISSSPDPTKNRFSLVVQPSLDPSHQDPKRRHTIRDIMQLAKSNAPKPSRIIPTVAKCVTPPLPKIIPNQILDDVQLFDFYYRNLNSVFIQEVPQHHQSFHQVEPVKTKS